MSAKLFSVAVAAVVLSGMAAMSRVAGAEDRPWPFEGPVGRAECGPGSRPESGLSGSIPVEERASGRSAEGYTCNLEQIGHYGSAEGFEGAEWQMAWYGQCAYYDTKLSGTQQKRGTIALDVGDPAAPRFSINLTTGAMIDPWESLKVNEARGLLAGVFVADAQGAAFFDVYDVKDDCARPRLLSSTPVNLLGHEGDWSPDGRTYYASGLTPGTINAIDVTDPTAPKLITTFKASTVIHGLGVSEDGNRLYLAHINEDFGSSLLNRESLVDTNGLGIYDISEINARKPMPEAPLLSALTWRDGAVGQHAVPFTRSGRSYVLFVDELFHGGARIIDITDEHSPVGVAKLKTEIQMPEHSERAEAETNYNGEKGGQLPFRYNSHYCNIDAPVDPTIVACSNFESGLRVFDIRTLTAPKEIGYFNPGGNGTRAPGSFGGTTGGYASAQPRIIPERGEIWFTDQDRGFYVVRFTNGVWPFPA